MEDSLDVRQEMDTAGKVRRSVMKMQKNNKVCHEEHPTPKVRTEFAITMEDFIGS